MTDVAIRRLEPSDSIEELTLLLNRAYAPLAARGLKFVATHQKPETTRSRIAGGECWVAVVEGRIVGTIMLYPASPPGPEDHRGCEWYRRPDVAKFGQFGVEPGWKGRGVGRLLMDRVERRARELGAAEIACDTALPAVELQETYARRGYRVVGRVDWRPDVNYESVLLSLKL